MTIDGYIKDFGNNSIKVIKWLKNRQSLNFKILEILKVLCTSFPLHSIKYSSIYIYKINSYKKPSKISNIKYYHKILSQIYVFKAL